MLSAPPPMVSPLFDPLQALAQWRSRMERNAADLARWLHAEGMVGDVELQRLQALRERLATDRLKLAFVAEFSRGKSELINAIFFADTGVRMLPATPGRTTMCPVELSWTPDRTPELALLPIDTRRRGLALADVQGRDEMWVRVPLDPSQPMLMAQALAEVTRTRRVSIDEARSHGLWNDEQPDFNPPVLADGQVDVPAWRHASINYPHPLLQQGLTVLDTPGLNAIGAEPELTLNLLPSAHAVVFMLSADAGVTRSDLAVWRGHLDSRSLERFVVLNKIDTLADPLSLPGIVELQIEQQCEATAQTLQVPLTRVFPLSARDALTARLDGDAERLARSRLQALEEALSTELMPRQQELLAAAVRETLEGVRQSAAHQLADRRRQLAEEMLELRGLKGKSSAKVRMMQGRVAEESEEFERCVSRLQAMRSVLARMQKACTDHLSSDRLRTGVNTLQGSLGARLLSLGLSRAFAQLMDQVRDELQQCCTQAQEMWEMMDASFTQLNADHGFSFVLAPLPDLGRFKNDLQRIETRYGAHLGVTQSWRLAAPGALEHFCRMLLSRLRVSFESASSELEMWGKAAENQVRVQLKERRRMYRQRAETLERIESASGELQTRLSELEEQEQQLRELHQSLEQRVHSAQRAALQASSELPTLAAVA
ncbi:MAG: dynamin family protein [Rubrivivax sp.]|nr:dynamin family protein [Rubrivivax sp.]